MFNIRNVFKVFILLIFCNVQIFSMVDDFFSNPDSQSYYSGEGADTFLDHLYQEINRHDEVMPDNTFLDFSKEALYLDCASMDLGYGDIANSFSIKKEDKTFVNKTGFTIKIAFRNGSSSESIYFDLNKNDTLIMYHCNGTGKKIQIADENKTIFSEIYKLSKYQKRSTYNIKFNKSRKSFALVISPSELYNFGCINLKNSFGFDVAVGMRFTPLTQKESSELARLSGFHEDALNAEEKIELNFLLGKERGVNDYVFIVKKNDCLIIPGDAFTERELKKGISFFVRRIRNEDSDYFIKLQEKSEKIKWDLGPVDLSSLIENFVNN